MSIIFDTKDLKITSPNISYINKSDLYETFLNVNTPRLNQEYIFNQDINGGFEIRNVMDQEIQTMKQTIVTYI